MGLDFIISRQLLVRGRVTNARTMENVVSFTEISCEIRQMQCCFDKSSNSENGTNKAVTDSARMDLCVSNLFSAEDRQCLKESVQAAKARVC